MCVVAFAWSAHPRWRLLLIGNRDEFHARPTAPLARWPDGLIAGQDLQAGGTWAGVDQTGRCAVVTNVRDPLSSRSLARSRGQLPVEALREGRDALASAHALAAQAGAYAPFNLLIADAGGCAYLGNHPYVDAAEVPAGLHGMSNGGFDVSWPKTARLRDALSDWLATDAVDPAPLWRSLRDARPFADASLPDTGVGLALERRLSPVFIEGRDYGTRASTIVAIGDDGEGWIAERRFGPDGVFAGETIEPLRQPRAD